MNNKTSCRTSPLKIGLSAWLGILVTLLLLSGITAARPAFPAGTVAPDPLVGDVLSQITTETLAYDLAGLTGERPVTVAGSLYTITTRNTVYTQAISMTTRYAYEQFEGYGVDVSYHTYAFNSGPRRNVVAEKAGLIRPDQVYLITAHVDNMPQEDRAPGADDNGTGSVAVMTAAQLLGSRHFVHTLRFVLFTGEEQGLLGSEAYAADCKGRGDGIKGVINLDMIGYSTGEPVFDIYARSGTEPGAPVSRQLADAISNTAGLHGLDLIPRTIYTDTYPLKWGSDQWSFLDQGYPAVLVIEDYAGGDSTPYYHTVSDTLDTLDLDYYADVTRAAVATLAQLGRPLPSDAVGWLSGTVSARQSGDPLPNAIVAAAWATRRYTFSAATDASGTYSSTLPPGRYTVTVSPASPGYKVTTITDVHIVTDSVSALNVALEPVETRLYLPLVLQRMR